MHMQKVGKPETLEGMVIPDGGLTTQDWEELKIHDPARYRIEKVASLVEKTITGALKKQRKSTHVDRVLNYMAKEMELPCQFTDYIYVVNAKNQTLVC